MKPYSMDIRSRVLEDADGGMTTREVALRYRVSESWVRRLKQRRRENGEIAPRPPRNGVQPKWLPYAERIEELVAAQPDITLRELRDALGEDISIQTLSRALRKLQLTFKKSDPRDRAGSTRRASATPLVAGGDAGRRSASPGVPGRDWRQHEDVPPLWSRPTWPTRGG